eukprot:2593686-Lingulodinium_polyedra.AAC.1
MGGDLASSNIRCKCYVASKLREHNATQAGRAVLLVDVFCMTHVLTRIVVRTFEYSKLLPELSCTT